MHSSDGAGSSNRAGPGGGVAGGDSLAGGVTIKPYAAIQPTAELLAGLDAIFFEASATKSFASASVKAAFQHRWLGSYLQADPDDAFVALSGDGRPAGYVVGALHDPAGDPRYDGLGYLQAFAPMSSRYPAHLHINLAPRFRSLGLGGRLIERFIDHARTRGVAGVHVVTSKGMRNVGFYLRNGFEIGAETEWNAGVLVMLVRRL